MLADNPGGRERPEGDEVTSKKLIEVALPLEAINRESVREKNIRHGHPSTLHLWWARRPLAAARAMLFAQMVDDPSSRPDKFPTEEEQNRERERLFGLIQRMVVWENSTDESLMASAAREIAESCDGDPPAIVDPFAGGGSIPLEAKRLGLHAVANDLNPLPVLINTVMLDLVDRFPLRRPTTGGILGDASPPAAIAADLRHWADVLESRVEARMGDAYPKSPSGATPLVYFWARTVMCPNPACGIEIPLVGQWKASGRKGSEAMFVPVPSADGRSVDVEVKHGRHPEPPWTLKRNSGRCPICGSGFDLAYVKAEGVAGRMGQRLLAVQESLTRKRSFRPATDEERQHAEMQAPDAGWLAADLSTHNQYMAPPRYGLTTFRDLFLPRQLSTLEAFTQELDSLSRDAEAAAARNLDNQDRRPFAEGGVGPAAYGDAIRILLSIGISRLVNRSSSLCIWDASRETVQQVFSMQAYKMTWLFAEANPFGGGSGGFAGQAGFLAKAIEALPAGEAATVIQAPAQEMRWPQGVVVSTDPPYYDAVPYADLSDFFLVWLRHMLGPTLPDVFPTVLAPKGDELVADHKRHNGKEAADRFFESGLAQVFSDARAAHAPGFPMTVYYAYKSTEKEGETSGPTGWETFLQALIDGGWAITGTWPIRTEQAGGLRELGRNALASSVVVVCRVKAEDAPVTNRRGLLQALQREIPPSLRLLQQGAVAPVDLAQAAIGPGMAVFSRYSRVVEADGSDMTVRTALALINQVLDEVLSEQEGDFDADTRFCIKWFTQFGWNDAKSGEAEVLAKATGSTVPGLVRGGVFRAVAGKARLLAPEELSVDWNPLTDDRVSHFEVAVRLAHALKADGIDSAAPLMAAAGQRVDLDTVHELAYLLYSVCEKKGWTDSGILFNSLGTSWADLTAAARSLAGQSASSQTALDFDDE